MVDQQISQSITTKLIQPQLNCKITLKHPLHINDLSFASTETKYIKLKTKTQNNIVIFGFFSKKQYCHFGFF